MVGWKVGILFEFSFVAGFGRCIDKALVLAHPLEEVFWFSGMFFEGISGFPVLSSRMDSICSWRTIRILQD
jgi:hypothetical protein